MKQREWHAQQAEIYERLVAIQRRQDERELLDQERLEAEYRAGGNVDRLTYADGLVYYIERERSTAPVKRPFHGGIAANLANMRPRPNAATKSPRPNARVSRPPGSLALRIAAFLPAGKRLRKDLEQVVADMRAEHFDALAIGDATAARIALVRGRFEIARAILPSWWGAVVSFVARWLGIPSM